MDESTACNRTNFYDKPLESKHPWLRVPETVDKLAVLEVFKQAMGLRSLGWPIRVLGQEAFLRGEALALKSYLLCNTPHGEDGHLVYRAPAHPGILISVSVTQNGTHFSVVGAPPEGPFWHGDFADGPPENPRTGLRRSRIGDRFLSKLAARTGGQGFESESELTYESHPDSDKLILRTEVNEFLPAKGHEVRRTVVAQDEVGECCEYGPLGDEFERPVVSRRSPMAVGQSYSVLYLLSDICCEEYVTVEAFEEVTVPAGTFEAFRLKLQSPLPQRLSWYSPELNTNIKETVNVEGYTSMEVLHEYELSE